MGKTFEINNLEEMCGAMCDNVVSSDSIKREDAIECVERGKDAWEVIDQISRLPSAKADWIPCSERLPRETGAIIVTLLDKRYGEYFVEDEWWTGDMFLNFGKPSSGYEVVAWMPYPMPYRKDSEV